MVLVVVIETESPGQALLVRDGATPSCPSVRIDGVLCSYADPVPILYRLNDALATAKTDPLEGRAREGHVPKWLRQVAV